MYRRLIGENGETIAIRRYTGTGGSRTSADTDVLARVTGYGQAELVGGVDQGDRKVIVLADDLVAAGFSLPVVKGDKVVVRGRELNIERPDDSTRRIAGELIALELQARG